MYSFILAILGAICWGLAPAFGKEGLKGVHPMDGLVARTIITALLVGLWVVFNDNLERLTSIPLRNWYLIALEAFLATFAGDLAYYAAIKYGSIGHTALVLSAAPIVTIWAGWYFLGESLSLVTLLGAGLIITGVILVGFSTS